MIAVEEYQETIGAGDAVSPGQLSPYRIRACVVQPRSHVERIVVVENPDLGPLGSGGTLVRLALGKVGDRHCGGPVGLGEDPVQGESTVKPDRVDHEAFGRFGYRVALTYGDQARQCEVERDCSCGVAH